MSDWIRRKPTNLVTVGNVKVGDFNPISVQSMTNTNTEDIDSTINQINNLAIAGADIVRVSVPTETLLKHSKKLRKLYLFLLLLIFILIINLLSQ